MLEILRGGHEHHWRGIRNRQDLLERFQPVEPWHVLIERDNVDAALRDTIQSLCAARGVHDLEAVPRQAAIDKAGERSIVVDIEQCWCFGVHVAADGT